MDEITAAAIRLARIFGDVRTPRLILRRPEEDDGSAMFRIHGDPETNRYNPQGPDPDLAASEATLQTWLQQWREEGFGYWAVTLRSDPTVIGFGGVRRLIWRNRDILNLYYRLTPSAWGRGYATEVAQSAVALARTHLPSLPVVARVRPVNRASARTAQRAGLPRRPDLDADEHHVYALGWLDPLNG